MKKKPILIDLASLRLSVEVDPVSEIWLSSGRKDLDTAVMVAARGIKRVKK